MYKLLQNTELVLRTLDNTFIPVNSGNRAWREYQEWLEAGNTPEPADEPTPVNPLDAAESHIASFFSTPRLLQMKVWWDAIPHEDTPKLAAVYDWVNNITIQAAQGDASFAASPNTFEELVAEVMEHLGVV